MTTKYNFEQQVAIVTGAAGGIGRAIATKLYSAGARVIISDINQEKGKQVADELGERAVFISCDVSNDLQVQELINNTIQRFGAIHIMINNAGVNGIKPEERVTVDNYPNDTWHRLIDVDLNGTFYCCKAAAKVMISQRQGNIINIASVAGVVALRLQIGFVAAKAAIIKMSEAMASELAPFGIRVNTVSPGSTITDVTRQLFYDEENGNPGLANRILSFIPMARPGEVEEIADAVLFLASDSSSYINGHNIVVDGGWMSAFNRDF